jgi:hypothetical protein
VNCAWILRDGSQCKSRAFVDGLCSSHFEMERALEAENAERVSRGEPPLSGRPREVFLKRWSHRRRVARRRVVQGRARPAV